MIRKIVTKKSATVSIDEARHLWNTDYSTVMFGISELGDLYLRGETDWRRLTDGFVKELEEDVQPTHLVSLADVRRFLEGGK